MVGGHGCHSVEAFHGCLEGGSRALEAGDGQVPQEHISCAASCLCWLHLWLGLASSFGLTGKPVSWMTAYGGLWVRPSSSCWPPRTPPRPGAGRPPRDCLLWLSSCIALRFPKWTKIHLRLFAQFIGTSQLSLENMICPSKLLISWLLLLKKSPPWSFPVKDPLPEHAALFTAEPFL